jgi:hypothetical protein
MSVHPTLVLRRVIPELLHLSILLSLPSGCRYGTIPPSQGDGTIMLRKLREILLTQYIGAILVALLGWQAAIEVVTTVVRSGFWYFNHQQSQSAFGSAKAKFPWDSVIFSAVTVGLYLLVAYALVRWLYPPDAPPAVTAAEEQPQAQSEQG